MYVPNQITERCTWFSYIVLLLQLIRTRNELGTFFRLLHALKIILVPKYRFMEVSQEGLKNVVC